MKNLAFPIGVFVLAVLAGVAIMVLPGKSDAPLESKNGQATTTPGKTDEGTAIAGIPDLISVGTPTKGAAVTSPLTITGSARGTWYFEASFPIEIRNEAGAVIAQGHAEAQSDWMTEDFVIFKAVISYPAQPKSSQGTVVLKNDNPSGDPARDKSVEIPVIFN